ncbi:MAG: hypothetical protein Q4F95_13945 [Oscillospiraceae bacterium]|nr:hypothetical protein [Oscillospiraceae bacterium]
MADFNSLFNYEDVTDQYDQSDISDLMVMSILGYVIPILFFLPKTAKQNSPYAAFISNQLFTLFVLNIILVFLGMIPIIGWIAKILSVGTLALRILGIIDCANNRAKKLPVIGQFIIQAFK